MSEVILVTGGAGFIGSHLTAYLARQGHHVIVLDDLSFGSLDNLNYFDIDFEIIQGDVAHPELFEQLRGQSIKKIYHMASQANVPLSVRQPVADFDTNMKGTLNVLEFAKVKNAQVIFPSTVSVYHKDCAKPITEDAVVHASSPYGAAKAGGENYCFAYTNCYGVRTVVARLFNVYGPLMSKYVIYDFVKKLHANPKSLSIIGSGKQIRDYTYIDDAVRAFVLLAEKGEAGTAYNLGSGNPTQILDLARIISQEMGLSDVELVCTQKAAIGDISEWYADITRLRGIGYEPQVSFSEGIRKTVDFILETA